MRLEILSPHDIEKIMENTYRIMEEIGMKIMSKKARDIYASLGCEIDKKIVKIPRSVVEAAIASCPSCIDIYDRKGNPAMRLTGRNCYYGSGPTCTYFMDPVTGERKLSTKANAGQTALVADALEHISFVMSLVTEQDVSPRLADVHEVDAMLRNTTKPIVTWANSKENLEDIIDLFAAVAGSREALAEKANVIIYSEPTTPLTHTKDALEKVMVLAENNIPCIYTPGIMMGATGPVTMAATLSLGVAECLTGLVLHQAIRKGAPFIGGVGAHPFDMKTMQPPYGAPESALTESATNEIFHYLDIPCWGLAGATDSHELDCRAGWEAAHSIMISRGTAGNLVHDCGFMDCGLLGSIQMMVMCDELIGMADKMFQGIEVNDETLAFDTIREVGHGGHYMAEEHTMNHFRKDVWQPTIFERWDYENWQKKGIGDMVSLIQAKTESILENHKPEPLSEDILKRMDQIVARAEDRIGD